MPTSPETRGQSIHGRLRIALWNVFKARGMGEDVIYRLINDVCAEATNLRSQPVPVASEGGEAVLPCDVRLPPRTTIRAGCKVSTLMEALAARGRPQSFATPLPVSSQDDEASMATDDPSLPADVVRLVLAARAVAFVDPIEFEARRELDQASEAFASRVGWDMDDV